MTEGKTTTASERRYTTGLLSVCVYRNVTLQVAANQQPKTWPFWVGSKGFASLNSQFLLILFLQIKSVGDSIDDKCYTIVIEFSRNGSSRN